MALRPRTPARNSSGWLLQTTMGIAAIAFALFGGEVLASQSGITKPILIIAGSLGIASGLYARFWPQKPSKPTPPRRY